MKAALSDQYRLARVGQRAFETIPIPWDRLVDDVLAVYAEILNKRGAQGA